MTRVEFLSQPVTSKEEAETFITKLHTEYDSLFHFEDDPADIGHTDEKGRWVKLFTPEEIPLVNDRVNELFDLLDDPFEIAVKLIS